jgi:hypothetical protein
MERENTYVYWEVDKASFPSKDVFLQYLCARSKIMTQCRIIDKLKVTVDRIQIFLIPASNLQYRNIDTQQVGAAI